jgi:hypothetical protein
VAMPKAEQANAVRSALRKRIKNNLLTIAGIQPTTRSR